MTRSQILPLTEIPKGGTVEVVEVPQGRSREQLIRLGILKGQVVRCLQRLPGGTMLIEKNRQEIAIGAALAGSILVRAAAQSVEQS